MSQIKKFLKLRSASKAMNCSKKERRKNSRLSFWKKLAFQSSLKVSKIEDNVKC